MITPAPPLNVAAPASAACVIAPLCVIPTALTVKVPVPTDDVPKIIALASVTATSKAPLLFKLTAPMKLLFPAPTNVITPAPALKVAAAVPAPAVCVIVVPAACVIPTALTANVPDPTNEDPRVIELASVT